MFLLCFFLTFLRDFLSVFGFFLHIFGCCVLSELLLYLLSIRGKPFVYLSSRSPLGM